MLKNVNVIMGGPSEEHEISLATGQEMIRHLDRNKYSEKAVIVSRKKAFYYSDEDPRNFAEKDFANPEKSKHFFGPISPAVSENIWKNCDVALLALHGEFGEDGRFQGFLETLDIPYTGSKIFASAVGMEKIVSKQLFAQNSINTPAYSVYNTESPSLSIEDVMQKHGLPCFVKCPQSGSSRLMGRADTREMLEDMLSRFSKKTVNILIESYISGDEYSCPVLEYPDGRIQALPPILIRPVKSDFFDYYAKYSKGASEEIVPAPCSPDLTKRIQEIALKAHSVLKCQCLSRTDMIVKEDTIYVLEVNTLPGLSSASLVPKAFAAIGGSFSELLDILIETTLAGRKK